MVLLFWLMIALGLICLWFLFSFAFKPIGKFFYRLWKEAVDEISDDEEKEKDNDVL